MEPTEFPPHLNSLLQELRNVDNLLGRKKRTVNDYQIWYHPMHELAKQSPVMKWVLDSRNRVVHQEDLDVYSRVKIRHALGMMVGNETELEAQPRATTRQIMIRLLSQIPTHLRSTGTVSVQRWWVDRKLPDNELLWATRDAFMHLHRMMRECHLAAEVPDCDLPARRRPCVTAQLAEAMPDCMTSIGLLTSLTIDLETNKEYRTEYREAGKPDVDEAELNRRVRGAGHVYVMGDALDNVDSFMRTAIRIVREDGVHLPMIHLWKGSTPAGIRGMPLLVRNLKTLLIGDVADQVAQAGADSMLLIMDHTLRGHGHGPAGEMLEVIAARKNGDVRLRHWFYDSSLPAGMDHVDEVATTQTPLDFLYPLKRLWNVHEWNVVRREEPYAPPPELPVPFMRPGETQ